MGLKLITSNVLEVANNFALKQLKNRDISCNTIIFTPDRMNFNIEYNIFNVLNENCFFDVNVTTLTRFSNNFIKEQECLKNVLTKPMAVAVVRKILSDENDSLKSFKNAVNFPDFASSVYEIISMFKSCNVNFSLIDTKVNNTVLKNKLEDIKLVYKKYEEFLQNDYTDSFNKLNLFKSLITKEKFSKTNILFVGFDDFTPQVYGIISKFVKCAKNVVISCTRSKTASKNKNIYLNNVYLNIKSLGQTNGFNVEEENVEEYENETVKYFANNLFGLNIDKAEANVYNNVNVLGFENVNNEIEFVAKQINYMVLKQNYNYSDFTIMCSNLSNFIKSIKYNFDMCEVPYFLDESKKLSDMVPALFFKSVFEVLTSNFKTLNVLNFLKNPILQIDSWNIAQFEDELKKYNVSYISNFNYIKTICSGQCLNVVERLIEFKNNCTNATFEKFISEYNNLLIDLKYNEGFENVIKLLNEENNIMQIKEMLQSEQKFVLGLENLNKILGNSKTDFKDFMQICVSYFESVSVTMPPIIDNCVFIGDANSSFFTTNKVLFVVGCADGSLPSFKSDLSIISDKDINLLSDSYKLAPTVNFINKKNKFKVFENCLKFKDKIYFSYSKFNENNEQQDLSLFVKSFLNKKTNAENKPLLGESFLSGCKLGAENSEFNLLSKKLCENELLKGVKNFEDNKNLELLNNLEKLKFVNSKLNNDVSYIFNNISADYKKEDVSDLAKVCFAKNEVSTTQFETYFKCPYKYFATYALRLKEKRDGSISKMDFGNILHKYMEMIVPKLEDFIKADSVDLEKLKMLTKACLNKVLSEDGYKKFVQNDANYYIIKALEDEVFRIAVEVCKEQKQSKFKPYYLEKYFKLQDFITLKSINKKISIVGVIDRVDKFEDKFRIIDYKSGSDKFENYNDLKSGKKIQLIVYLMGFAKNSKLKPVGALYMPLKNSFVNSNSETLYRMQGVLTNEIETLLLMDENVLNYKYDSPYITVSTDQKGGFTKKTKKLLLSDSDFENLQKYVVKKIYSAVQSIESGNITPEPLKENDRSTCTYCPFLGMCKFSVLKGNRYKECKNAGTIEELLEEN